MKEGRMERKEEKWNKKVRIGRRKNYELERYKKSWKVKKENEIPQ